MKFIRFDSVGGASGDMILGTLIGLGVKPDYIEQELSSVIPGEFHLRTRLLMSHGVEALQVTVDVSDDGSGHHSLQSHDHEEGHAASHVHTHSHHHEHTSSSSGHAHRSFADIRKLIDASALSNEIKRDAVALFQALAEAEGAVHKKSPEEVCFHEVGAVDSIVDIIGAVIGMHFLGIEAILIGPIPVGSGTVRCAHGVYPVPAPAVAELLEMFRIPISLDGREGEMLTPTGAVLLGWWRKVPESKIRSARLCKSASALGQREFSDRPNLLRASLLETADEVTDGAENETREQLVQFDANLDDVSGEVLAHTANLLFRAGALDVWFTPVQMKKGRPGVVLSVLLAPNRREEFLDLIFTQTGTFGVRETELNRYALGRRFTPVKTSGGPVNIKSGFWQGKEVHFAPEFNDCITAAEKADQPVRRIYREAVSEYLAQRDRIGSGREEGKH